MSRVFAILLILVCLVAQPLPHVHAGAVADNEDCAHFHLRHLLLACGVGNGSPCDCSLPHQCKFAPDEDEDAIYVGDVQAAGSVSKVLAPEMVPLQSVVWKSLFAPPQMTHRFVRAIAVPASLSDSPIFLLFGSLRI